MVFVEARFNDKIALFKDDEILENNVQLIETEVSPPKTLCAVESPLEDAHSTTHEVISIKYVTHTKSLTFIVNVMIAED